MSLITSYFKKEVPCTGALLPRLPNDNSDTSEVKCPESVQHSVDLSLNKECTAGPPKKMKIALFAARESPIDLTTDSMRNNEVEKNDIPQEPAVTLTTCEELIVSRVTTEDSEVQEKGSAQLTKLQSRQTTLKFENGKCLLVPMEQSTGMETCSQESSQVDSTGEDDYHPKKQQRKKKRHKRKCSNEEACSDNFVENVEQPTVTKKSSRRAAKEAAKQLNELLQDGVPPQSSLLSNLTNENDQVVFLPEILVEDSDIVKECAIDGKSNGPNKLIAEEGVTIEVSSTAVAKEVTIDDSSDSDVICLTPHSASPVSQDSTEQLSSQPATPAKNKWSHIFGNKSPQKKSSPSKKSSPHKGSPGRGSPRRGSPRKSNPARQVAMTLSSLTTSHEHYTLGIPLFYHVMQKDNSLWGLPKVEISSINAHLSHHPHVHPGASHALCKDHVSRKLINCSSDIQRKPLQLKVIFALVSITLYSKNLKLRVRSSFSNIVMFKLSRVEILKMVIFTQSCSHY